MFGDIEMKKGYIIESCDGRFLDENLSWEETVIEGAYIHPGTLRDLEAILDTAGACYVYEAIVFNGHLLLSKPRHWIPMEYSLN